MPGGILHAMAEDWDAVARNDPAARSRAETALCHTALHAIWTHRIAHALHVRFGLRTLARWISALAYVWSGVEIHPGARIGRSFFIDHGNGVVIGETSSIGDDCVLFHNVTLGGTGKHGGKRHPTLCDRVFVGTGATLLGPITVGENAKIGAGSFIHMRDVPANCTAVGTPARIVKRDGERVDVELPRASLSDASIPVAIPGDTRRATGSAS
jgi:serine O-acetyltransferase